jgi:hypothetical protein
MKVTPPCCCFLNPFTLLFSFFPNIQVRLERAGAATFTLLLELTTRSSWRLHMDVEHSVDRLLADKQAQQLQQKQSASSSSSSSRGHLMLQPLTQVRRSVVRGDGQQQLLVRFESTAAAAKMLAWAAKLADAGAGGGGGGDGDDDDDGSLFADLTRPVAATHADVDRLKGNSSAAPQQQQQQRLARFAGGWLVDLLHVALHCAVTSESRAI